MFSDKRFMLSILLVPYVAYSDKDKEEALKRLRNYFSNKGIQFYDFRSYDLTYITLKSGLDPDFIFFPQPYDNCFAPCLSSQSFEKKLICYSPYGMPTIFEEWTINLRFHNIAWRFYYPTSANWEDFLKNSFIKGRNVRVVGDPIADQFNSSETLDIWKPQDKNKKRIIWAPHYSIKNNSSGMLHRDSFDWLSDVMLEIASEYKDRIQFSFKPHPRLFQELENSEGWGSKRAGEYYSIWDLSPNTQLDTGEYVNLFKTSDAIIHDCASFTAEYHFTGKPALFVTKDIDSQRAQLTSFGKMALDCHYIGKCTDDIRSFIDEVVLKERDPLKDAREKFKATYLCPPGGKSSAENIYEDIITSIGFKN